MARHDRNSDFIPYIKNAIVVNHLFESTWINQVNEAIHILNATYSSIPDDLKWEFMTKDAFVKAATRSTNALNLYWRDTLCNIQAFSVFSTIRTADLLRSAVLSISREEYILAAMAARGAIETVASYARFQMKVRPGLEKMSESTILYPAKDLEELILKTLFGSRELGDDYKVTNISTILTKITEKIPHQQTIGQIYSSLCEYVHPNMNGLQVYVTDAIPGPVEGSAFKIISKKPGPQKDHIAKLCLEAISWSAGTMANSCSALQQRTKELLDVIVNGH